MDTEAQSDLCFPQLTNLSCRKSSSALPNDILLNITLPVVCVLTVVLNLLVIISISHFRQLHTPTNLLLLSLSVTDLLVGLLMIVGQLYNQASCWFLGDSLCSLFRVFMITVTTASIGNMVLISVDRYVAICDPLHYIVKVTVKRIQHGVCLCWFLSLFSCCIILNDQLTDPGKYNSCYGECVITVDYNAGVAELVVTFIFPLSIIVTLYTRVFVAAVSQARAMRSHVKCVRLHHSVPLRAKKSELKAARTLGVLILVFLTSFCPYYIFSLTNHSKKMTPLKSYFLYLYSFNSCVNPLIYTLFYPWFRKAVRQIVTLRIFRSGSSEVNIL
ncbi:trace amine-associated receptor 13c-like [Syngnathoides biaculeatus]|uniref:trace amine-associated receptor 13c-like n=1 Tax=Syngnathoides biaculeatus TaxID=300417 RepID=UPI002ADD552E|nr:trace amine-associated receptor 13c-like [Syngnathoides biaculeatus]